jgi:hypothetical protein
VSVFAESMLIVPPEELSVIPLAVSSVNDSVAVNVPPANEIDAAVVDPGTAPRDRSCGIDTVPAEIVVDPAYVLVPVRRNVPLEILVRFPAPSITPS